LSGCDDITDEGIRSLSLACHELTNLNISHCYEISVLSLQYLQQGCPLLHSLDLSGCVNITEEDQQYLPVACQQVANKCLVAASAGEGGGFQFGFDFA
jgi:hypothetical protein